MRATACCIVLAFGCSAESDSAAEPDAGSEQGPTYYQDIAPILHTHCVGCHSDGGIAPFALDSADSAVAAAAAVAFATTEKVMPPWPPGELSKPMLHERTLTTDQIELISAWSVAGAPLGDPDSPGPLVDPEEIDTGPVDLTFDIGVDYVPDASFTDDYRCFMVDLDVTEIRAIRGYRVLPGNAKTVHHVIAGSFTAGSRDALVALDAESPERAGWPCFSGLVPQDVDAQQNGGIGPWVPGVSAVAYPEGTGRYLVPGSVAVVQIHYNLAGGIDPDRTAIELALAPVGTTITPLTGVGLVNRSLNIGAGDDSAEFVRTLTVAQWIAFRGGQEPVDGDSYILGVGAHAHLLATEMELSINGEPILDIPRWDFHWQGSYQLREPIRVEMSDTMTLRCVYNNSDAYRAAQGLGPSVPVVFGDGTEDEMCLGSFTAVDELP